jgi:hypothetical protein
MIEKLLNAARSKIGVTESPANSNTVEFNTWYYGKVVSGASYPWCAVFCLMCAFTAGILGLLWGTLNDAKRAVAESAGSWMALAQKQGRWITSGFKPGDFVIFDWNGTRTRSDHIGIVESVNADGSLVTIEGNTSSSDSGSQSNGGGVFRRTRALKWITGAFRPAYVVAAQPAPAPTATVAPAFPPKWAVDEGVIEWAKAHGFNVSGKEEEYWLKTVTKLELAAILKRQG